MRAAACDCTAKEAAASRPVVQPCPRAIGTGVAQWVLSDIVIVYLHCTKQYLRLPNRIADNLHNSTGC